MKIWNLTRSADGRTVDITLYGIIGQDWWTGESTDKTIAAELAACTDATQINVHINSEGGDAFAGIAIYNMLQAHPAAKTCIVEGLAASAASIVAMAGKTVMGLGSMLMVHNPWAIVAGDANDMRSAAEMLDAVQSSLIAIYVAKTGKAAAELKTLLDAETWMTAEQAVTNGFANESIATPIVVEDRGATVVLNAISFARDRVPAQILAMAKPPTPEPAKPPLALVPPPAPPEPLTRAEVQLRAPELVTALVAEGHAAGVAAERARLKAIDELDIPGCSDLVIAAKYGDAPSDAPTLALAIVKAGKLASAELLALRRAESAAHAKIAPGSPDQTGEAEYARHLAVMAAAANKRMGGTPK